LLARTDAAVRPVRLLGIGASGLVSAAEPRQLGLEERPWDDLERTIASVRDRFGASVLDRASLTGDDGSRRESPGPR
jgi:hypothetical protein